MLSDRAVADDRMHIPTGDNDSPAVAGGLGRALSAAREAVAGMGLVNGSMYLVGRALEKVTGGRGRLVKYHFVAQPVKAEPLAKGVPGGHFQIGLVDANDPIVAAFPRPPEVIRWRFRSGARCFVATQRGEFVGFLWLSLGRYEEDEVRCTYLLTPPDRNAWDFDVYVIPAARMGRTFARLWDAANEYMRARDIDWTISRISGFNVQSLRSHQRLGAQLLGTGLFLCLGRWQISFFSQRPFIHISLGSARPLLRLGAPSAR